MKLIIENDDGARVEVRKIKKLKSDGDILFFFLDYGALRPEDRENIESHLSKETGKKCILLDGRFHDKIIAF